MRPIAALAGLAALLAAGPALAHAHLQSCTPPVDAVLAAAPETLACSFSEALEPSLSRLSVRDAAGTERAANPVLAPGNPRQLLLKLPQLPPGAYVVNWVAVSVDTHRTEGRFGFTIGR